MYVKGFVIIFAYLCRFFGLKAEHLKFGLTDGQTIQEVWL